MGNGRDSPMTAKTSNTSTATIEPGLPGSGGCPSNSELATHLAGDTGKVGSRVANHLMLCRRCQLMANVVYTAVLAFSKR